MKFLKIAVPILVLAGGCNGGEEDPEGIACEATPPIMVPVTVADTNGDPLDATVEIATVNPENPDGFDPELPITVETPCEGSGGSYTCPAYPTDELNQVTATLFPGYQPAAAQAVVSGEDCESVTIELRMLPAQK